MTTVDVYIRRTGTRNSLSLRNGLFGPATTLFHSVLRACQDGTASGSWGGSHAGVVLSGAALRPMLAGLDHLGRLWHGTTEAQVTAYRDALADDAAYEINAIEVLSRRARDRPCPLKGLQVEREQPGTLAPPQMQHRAQLFRNPPGALEHQQLIIREHHSRVRLASMQPDLHAMAG